VSDEERKERIDEAADAGVEEQAAESKAAAAEADAEAAADAGDAEPEAEVKPKPKPRRARRKKAEPKAEEAKQEAAEEEAEAEQAEAEGEPVAEDAEGEPEKKPRRRRSGAAEVAAAKAKPAKSPPRRDAAGAVSVRAQAKYVRCAPRKARLVVDHIRGKSVDSARAILLTTPRAASRDVLKLLDSAIANAENNHELVADELVVGRVFVDEGPTLKRYRPRALGRATRIRKRTSHMTIELTTTENGKQG
jgi:ribosomal protein L22